jgi:hypothetical protein
MPGHDPPAISLLKNIDDFDVRLFGALANESTAQALKPLAWDEVGEKIWVPASEAYRQRYGEDLTSITPRAIPEFS